MLLLSYFKILQELHIQPSTASQQLLSRKVLQHPLVQPGLQQPFLLLPRLLLVHNHPFYEGRTYLGQVRLYQLTLGRHLLLQQVVALPAEHDEGVLVP